MTRNETRELLIPQQTIKLSHRKDGSFPDEYRIAAFVDEGGSSVCYKAQRLCDGYAEAGTLKEFYPENIGGEALCRVTRLTSGQLAAHSGNVRKFESMRDEYAGVYQRLESAISENTCSEIIRNYIPHAEILYGVLDENDIALTGGGDAVPTAYVWTLGTQGRNFEDYLSDVRASCGKNPEKKLGDILRTVFTLTDCVKILHTAGLLHLDIKPSNFLVSYDSELNINPSSISMFDINTLQSVDSEFPVRAGSIGYTAPEVTSGGELSNCTDIYSIGAMLFRAIVFDEERPDGMIYRDELYPDIEELVKNSALIKRSIANSQPKVTAAICRILSKCLCFYQDERYDSCTSLLQAIERACAAHSSAIVELKKESIGLTDPAVIMYKLLYDRPLYDFIGGNTLDVLVIGTGTYGQKFIDVCLQAGQFRDVKLSITAFSETAVCDMEEYLKARTALSRFVNVNGSDTDDDRRSYGELRFIGPEDLGETTDISGYLNAIWKLLCRKVGYVFVADGSAEMIRKTAQYCLDNVERRGYKCEVCYVSDKKPKKLAKNEKLVPVYINSPIKLEDIGEELVRIAFNTHLTWLDSPNVDINDEYIRFLNDGYSFSSSVIFALMLKYKLFAAGLDGLDPITAARRFDSEILRKRKTDENADGIFRALTALEHRRWVMNYVTEGWAPPLRADGSLDFEGCIANASVKDKARKLHPCIVFGGEDMPLDSEEYTKYNRAKWDDPNIDPELDELDRMSLELHQFLAGRAEQGKADSLLYVEDLKAIGELLDRTGDEAVTYAFKRYEFCLKNIFAGAERYITQYESYRREFEASLSGIDESAGVFVRERVNSISKALFPVTEAALYRDYKKIDAVLIEKLPFILTYALTNSLALAFEDGREYGGINSAVFSSVASASVLCPKTLIYLYRCEGGFSSDMLADKLSAVLNYLDRRQMRCDVVFYAARLPEEDKSCELDGALSDLLVSNAAGGSSAKLIDYRIFDCEDEKDAADKLYGALKEEKPDLYDGGTRLFASATGNGHFMERIIASGAAYCEFDHVNRKFECLHNCAWLEFAYTDAFLRVDDMFALMNAADKKFSFPEYDEDYRELWKIYTSSYQKPEYRFANSVQNWCRLCVTLGAYHEGLPPLARFELKNYFEPQNKYKIIIPAYAGGFIEKLLSVLKRNQLVGNESRVAAYSSDSKKLIVFCGKSVFEQMSKLADSSQYLFSHYRPEIYETQELVLVKGGSLNVENIDISTPGKDLSYFTFGILDKLRGRGFISGLRRDEENPSLISFTYSSPRIRDVLTDPGKILEIYIFYKLLESGYFDDAVCGYEFSWESGGVSNEIDVAVTKGFASVIIECKAVQKLEQNFYHKLHSLSIRFGINTKGVLIGNTYKDGIEAVARDNDMQRSRGRQLGIVTVSSQGDIENIAEIIKGLIE